MSEPTSSGAVLIACGGTGGHLFPGIAIAEKLKARGIDVILLISEKQIDTVASKGYADRFRFERIPSVAMPKPWSPKMIPFLLNLRAAISKSRKLIREIGATHVIGMGGFTSTAPLIAAKKEGCVGLIHESNAIPGRANRLNAKIATWALVGWDACAKHFPEGKAKVVGTPVRSSLYDLPDKAIARQHFGLNSGRFTLFVMGGSQGARGINEAVTGMLEYFDPELCQFLHIAGATDIEVVQEAYKSANVTAHVIPFLSEMEWAYAASDLIVCRSGASSLTEMSVVGLPGILVPYPHAADDHQNRNADIFEEEGACMVIQQADLKPLELAEIVASLGNDPNRLQQMSEKIRSLAPQNPADAICDLIENQTP
tara:strand:+ start:20102 stop:21211 length:1110 start_codon:yes stop_codon:yes gene_type:complete